MTATVAEVSITWEQALAWRLQRQLLEPVGTGSVADVVRTLGAVLAMDEAAAELAVRLRCARSRPGDLARALGAGEVVKVFAYRGAVHYLATHDAGAYLALRAAGRQWELPSWQEHYRLSAGDWPAFRTAIREAVADGPLTISELGAAVTSKAAYRHLRPVFDDGAGTLIKPLTWQGDLCLGPGRDGQLTYQGLAANPRWKGVWDLDEAGPYAIAAYFGSYGPATRDHIDYWLGSGLSAGRKRLQAWLAQLGDRLVEVDVAGRTALVLADDVEDLMSARPSTAVRLLPGHDQWVIGPGTKDARVVPPAHREPVTRKANLVVVAGVVRGTWRRRADVLEVTWFGEYGEPPLALLAQEIARLASLLERSLTMSVVVE